MPSITIPSEYGYVLGAAALSALYLISLSIKVGTTRIAAGVPYPYAYAEKADAEKDPKKHIFNCVQRAHQNTLEMFPVYSTFLLIGGITYPKFSAACASVFLLGRFVFVKNYSTGKPEKRVRGGFGMLGLLGLLGASAVTVYELLK